MKSSQIVEKQPGNPSGNDRLLQTGTPGESVNAPSRAARLSEIGVVVIVLVVACGLRLFAGTHVGLEVDEPIYRYAAAYAAQYGFPAVRPAANQPLIPFLYHPPFFLWLLGGWFKLWGTMSYFTGKMFNILLSAGMLGLLYAFMRTHIGKGAALLTLFLVGSDVWLIFTNQAIYFENSQMLFIILAIWAYWRATESDQANVRQYVLRYLLAGLLVGWVIVYKQIGGYLLIGVLANLLMLRKHWLGHTMLFLAVVSVIAIYMAGMHVAFGALFDSATLTQIERTLWYRQSPGLSYGPLTALQAIVFRYWIFPVTIITLVGGSILVCFRFLQQLLGKRKEPHPVLLGWALGGVVFALSISLKSPHYMILWLVPLYTFLSVEILALFHQHSLIGGRKQVFWRIALAGLLAVNLWSFQARFLHLPGDALIQAEAYINTHVASNELVVTQDFIGVDITPGYLNIASIDTPARLLQSGATYVAFYWSTTEPLPASFGNPDTYCTPLKTFAGFKDHVEVCKLR